MRRRRVDAASDHPNPAARIDSKAADAVTPTEETSNSRRVPVRWIWTALLLGGLLFIPGALGFFFTGLSFATGTALVSVAAILLAGTGHIPFSTRDAQGALVVAIVATFLILVHLLIAYAIDFDPQFDFGRALLSLGLMALILVSVPGVRNTMMDPNNKLEFIIKTICAIFVVIAILSLLQIQPPTESLGEKPTFPYTEPSFLGFSMPAVLIFTLIRSSKIVKIGIIGIFLILGYFLSNFTIIAACGLAAIVALPISWVFVGVGIIVISLAGLDLTYYTDRLNFDWASSTNLSSLVYVQGWQMIQESVSRTYAWGVGFQQLGIVYTNVPASFRINMLLGFDLNIQDGGFVLSKIISEMGILGALLVSLYLYLAGKTFLELKVSVKRLSSISDGSLFARACVLGYMIELFVRGANYFTGTFVLMLAGSLYMITERTEASENTLALAR